jgi:hypothetical protein
MFLYYHVYPTDTPRFRFYLNHVMHKRLRTRVGFPYEFVFALLSHAEERYNAVKLLAEFVRYAVS